MKCLSIFLLLRLTKSLKSVMSKLVVLWPTMIENAQIFQIYIFFSKSSPFDFITKCSLPSCQISCSFDFYKLKKKKKVARKVRITRNHKMKETAI